MMNQTIFRKSRFLTAVYICYEVSNLSISNGLEKCESSEKAWEWKIENSLCGKEINQLCHEDGEIELRSEKDEKLACVW